MPQREDRMVLVPAAEALLEACAPYFELTDAERDRQIQLACRTAMDQWMALPEADRIRWPEEPGPMGDAILRRWAAELHERADGQAER